MIARDSVVARASIVASAFRRKLGALASLPAEAGSHEINAAALVFIISGCLLHAQIIDRVLAVVAGTPITLSDVTAAVRLGLLPARAGGSTEQAALEALIDRELQLIEVNRYAPPEPAEANIAARLASVRSRFANGAAFEAALKETGVDLAQLRARIRDNLRIETYVQQRFGTVSQPSEDDVLRYYRTHPGEFTRDGKLPPFPEVRDEARRRLLDERTASLMKDWLSGLRHRVDVTILPK